MAIRTLHNLVNDEKKILQDVQRVILNDLYVDYVVTGANSETSALKLQQDLIKILLCGHFELRKSSSNSAVLLEVIPPTHCKKDSVIFTESISDYIKVLGLKWEFKLNAYQYQPNPVRFNKRAIPSETARIYDLIKLLTSITTNLKRMMKYLWSIKVGWNGSIPEDAAESWSRYHEELPIIGSVQVPRQVTTNGAMHDLHDFCDSSEISYAAVVYLLVREIDGNTHCSLLMGKSKVAPEKKLSISRLELCGALFLARTLNYLQTNLTSLPIKTITA